VNAIELAGVGKRYRQYQEGHQLLVRQLLNVGRRQKRELWALRDLTFQVARGESVGVIGRNGSGKTSLLRLLSGVSAPTAGRLRVVGSVAPLIGVGVGFNPELTGRENVFVNGRLLGMSEPEISRKYDDIVAFAEIEPFIDTPVKFYSTGMFLRLAFAVAVHTEPQVLIVDEVLAVGDVGFQLKCNDRMRQMRENGTTVVIVTHNMQHLDRLVSRTLLLNHGRLAFDGPTADAIGEYHQILLAEAREPLGDIRGTGLRPEGHHAGRALGGARAAVRLTTTTGEPLSSVPSGERFVVHVDVEFDRPVSAPRVGMLLAPSGLGAIYNVATLPGQYSGEHGPGRPLSASFELANPLLAGAYVVEAAVFEREHMLARTPAATFYVSSDLPVGGFVDMAPKVTLGGERIVIGPLRRLDAGEVSQPSLVRERNP
jgi:ABC-type polysaccharide/polyol phosphate transport system ATPase subunit